MKLEKEGIINVLIRDVNIYLLYIIVMITILLKKDLLANGVAVLMKVSNDEFLYTPAIYMS